MSLYGNYRAVVVDNNSPGKDGCIKIDVPTLCFEGLWAEPAVHLVGGAEGVESVFIPHVGDWLWIFFDGGCPESPIYFAAAPRGKDMPEAFKRVDELHMRRQSNRKTLITSGFVPWSEPAGPTRIEYPYNRGIKFHGGLLIEVDEKGEETRASLYHPSGSYMELENDGDVACRVSNNKYEVIIGKNHIFVGGDELKTIEGALNSSVKGNVTENVDGNVTEQIKGNLMATIQGSLQMSAQALSGTVGGNMVSLDSSGLSLMIQSAINIITQAAMTFNATSIDMISTGPISLRGPSILLGPGTAPVHVQGQSFCAFIGLPVIGGSSIIMGG